MNSLRSTERLRGVFPAFYACYAENGEVSPPRARALAEHLMRSGVDGLYVGGSSGECIYQTVSERMATLEAVMEAVDGSIAVIAHVACNGVAESRLLAAHAEKLGVDAIAAIPPIYFRLPERAVAGYWNAISDAAPHTPFIVYNIPQLAGFALTPTLLRELRKNPNVVGVKNSSMPVVDIQTWMLIGGEDFIVFNGPDEQFIPGLAAGARGGIGGTYGAMPELFTRAYALFMAGRLDEARLLQNEICGVISDLCAGEGSMYAIIKAILREKGVEIGGVRAPMPDVTCADAPLIAACARRIDEAIGRFC